jgi:hypothetical protein
MLILERRGRSARHLVVVSLLLAALVTGCARTGPMARPAWECYGYSGCKDDPTTGGVSGTRDSEACIRYEYDGIGTLRLTHIDAACNCWAVNAGGDVEFLPGYGIHIEMWEEVETPATCVCLFDVSYEITRLLPGTYRLTVDEMYLWAPEDEPFDFVLDIEGACSGEVCLPRWDLWWGQAADR